MSESFIHYLWKYQYFQKENLFTTDQEPVQIFSTGLHNTQSGPDFSNARIQVGSMHWVGNIEIHVHGADWENHKHHEDPAYENVILHVVWSKPTRVLRRDGSIIPTVELSARVSEHLIFEYRKLINSFEQIPCAGYLPAISPLVKISTLDNMLTTRLETRAREVHRLLERNKGDWEETCYQVLARNFGFKVNTEPFFQLSHTISYRMLLKHADKPEQVEALLFGAAGFLDDVGDDGYYKLLQREFNVLRQKYSLLERSMHKMQWKFLRLRPANFPTLRLAQFSALLLKRKNLFSLLLQRESPESLAELFSNETSPYWTTHYHFRKQVKTVPSLGHDSIINLALNSVVPLFAAYAISKDDYEYMEKAVHLLSRLPAECNKITRQWDLLSFNSKTAFESQALIELYNNFCSKRRCLDCRIGGQLLKPPSS